MDCSILYLGPQAILNFFFVCSMKNGVKFNLNYRYSIIQALFGEKAILSPHRIVFVIVSAGSISELSRSVSFIHF